MLFADLRGFTARFDGARPARRRPLLLRRFYRCAEDVLFPDAMIDKLIGDEVMALYLPDVKRHVDRDDVAGADARPRPRAAARGRLRHGGGPFAEMGIGLDFGEAFVGNIGQRALYDFTAVGDVVNTASRLQGQAGGRRVRALRARRRRLPMPVGTRVQLELKGIRQPRSRTASRC